VLFGPKVSVHAGNHRIDIIGKYMRDIGIGDKIPENDQDVVIADDVWIGTNTTILKGTRIGEGVIIGAGCVVSGNIPPYTIITGNLMREQKERFTSEEISRHKELIDRIKNKQ